MTLFDLLFLLLFLAAVTTLIVAAISALRGQGARAIGLLRKLMIGTVAYLGMVYAATALSAPIVLHPGDADCNDDWCLAVEGAKRTPKDSLAIYDVTLRIFSRARGRAQREGLATDVYLRDSHWNRYDPLHNPSDIPLNTLLQPGESVTTHRLFDVPGGAKELSLLVGRAGLPICLIIGECEAFHKGTRIRIY